MTGSLRAWPAVLLVLVPIAARAQAPIAIAFEGESECPTRGEVLDALGPGFVAEAESTLRVRITTRGSDLSLEVAEAGRAPVERELPAADCATRARLIAIIVRGYARDAPPIPAPAPRFAAIAAAAIGAALEIDPTNPAFAAHLEGGLSASDWRVRLVVSGTSPTAIGEPGHPIERLAMLVRLDVGVGSMIGNDVELAATFGTGGAVAVVSPQRTSLVRATLLVGAAALLELRIADPLWLRAELGADVPLLQDQYLVAPGTIADGVPDIAGRAPIAWARALIGIALRGQ